MHIELAVVIKKPFCHNAVNLLELKVKFKMKAIAWKYNWFCVF